MGECSISIQFFTKNYIISMKHSIGIAVQCSTTSRYVCGYFCHVSLEWSGCDRSIRGVITKPVLRQEATKKI